MDGNGKRSRAEGGKRRATPKPGLRRVAMSVLADTAVDATSASNASTQTYFGCLPPTRAKLPTSPLLDFPVVVANSCLPRWGAGQYQKGQAASQGEQEANQGSACRYLVCRSAMATAKPSMRLSSQRVSRASAAM